MHRFLIEPGSMTGDELKIEGEECRHLSQVLRLRPGDELVAIDGTGAEYIAELLTVSRQEAIARRKQTRFPDVESSHEIILLQGLPKQDKMDLIVQKAVELGVSRVVPIFTEYSMVRNHGDMAGKVARWNRISREAVKQCRRTKIPEVMTPMTMKEASSAWKGDLGILLYEQERKKDLKGLLKWYNMKQYHRLSILVGPEGGISPAEASYLEASGFESVTLGNRILRTETASLAALSIIMHETGGFDDRKDNFCGDG